MADNPISGQDLNRFTRTVNVGGLSFPVLDYGEGSPVLLLHGFPDDRFLWRNQAIELPTAGLRVIAPDLRGFGDAPRPADPAEYGLDIAAKDVIGILDALGIRPGAVGRARLGCRARLAHRGSLSEPRVALRGAVGRAPGAAPTAEQKEKSAYMLFFRKPGVEEEIQRDDWKWFRTWLRNAPDTARYIDRLSRPGALTAGLNWYRASNARPAGSAPLVVVSCPVPASGATATPT